MSRKTEVIIAILVLVLLAILLFFLWPRGREAPDANTKNQGGGAENTDDAVAIEEPALPQHATPNTVARIFVERFGSYSTETDYANVDDVMPIATSSLQKRLQTLAEEARRAVAGSYYGVSTNVIKVTVESQTDAAATLLVKTQREEAFDSPGNTSVRYTDIRVEFVKVGEDWFVNDFSWL